MLKDRLRAHPRSRGENPYAASNDQDPKGSSPLTRGKRADVSAAPMSWGLIPAHAGKTRRCSRGQGRPPAHPRSRGENRCRRVVVRVARGSSPLTRGKLAVALQVSWSQGLIPAHAGKTCSASMTRSSVGAHPRSRGENVAVRADSRWSSGSSPLTRGKPSGCPTRPPACRLIPAHAGKTRAPWARAHAPGGSSPLTRGKRASCSRDCSSPGLIPAHAGKTPPRARLR